MEKSTHAACRYLRSLILDFGSGSSVMLALAAYNLGPGKVKQAVANNVQDPIKQRNFWYLYRTRSLPVETREYAEGAGGDHRGAAAAARFIARMTAWYAGRRRGDADVGIRIGSWRVARQLVLEKGSPVAAVAGP